MNEFQVLNNTDSPMYVAGMMIPPGETRHFDAEAGAGAFAAGSG
jgi:hypothetical protein